MSTNDDPISEYDLHAFVDDQLDTARRARVRAHLEGDLDAAARVASWKQQKAQLRALFDPVLSETVPAELTAFAAVRLGRGFGWLRHAALALIYVSAGVAGGLYLASAPPAQIDQPLALERQAALAHAVYTPERRHAVEVGADQQAHLVRWLSKRLDHSLSVPDLSAKGMQLVGGRLLPGDRGPAAQFMYEDAQGSRLTLFVRRDIEQSHDTAFRFSRSNGISVFYWIDDHLGYALSGELDREPLLALASDIYAQIKKR